MMCKTCENADDGVHGNDIRASLSHNTNNMMKTLNKSYASYK